MFTFDEKEALIELLKMQIEVNEGLGDEFVELNPLYESALTKLQE